MATPPQRVELAVANNRRRDRAGLVVLVDESLFRVGDVINVAPHWVAALLVNTVNALAGLKADQLGVGDVDPPVGDNRAGESPADGDAPVGRETLAGEGFGDTGFVPGAVAVRPAPLRPVVGRHRSRWENRHRNHNHEMNVAQCPEVDEAAKQRRHSNRARSLCRIMPLRIYGSGLE